MTWSRVLQRLHFGKSLGFTNVFSVAPPFVPAISRGLVSQTKRESKRRIAKELKSEGGLDLSRVV